MNESNRVKSITGLIELPARPKILLVRFSALGDVIQTLPILPILRRRYPDAYIGWAVDNELVPAIEGHTMLDRIHRSHRKRWSKELRNPRNWARVSRELGEFVNDVKSVEYDVALDVQGLLKTALLTFFSGARTRIGFAHGREGSRLFYQHALIGRSEYYDPDQHHVDQMAKLAAAIGCDWTGEYEATLPIVAAETVDKIRQLLWQAFQGNRKIVLLSPGTQWESKKWPEHHWIDLTKRILSDTEFGIVMVGSRGDQAVVARILEHVPDSKGRILDISGKTDIRELYALYAQADAAVASDTAPLHIAGAAATPHVFGLFGPTSTKRTSPIGSPGTQLFSTEGQLSCQPCHKRDCPLGTGECLERIGAQSVFTALVKALSGAALQSR